MCTYVHTVHAHVDIRIQGILVDYLFSTQRYGAELRTYFYNDLSMPQIIRSRLEDGEWMEDVKSYKVVSFQC